MRTDKKGSVLITFGAVLVIAAILLTGYNRIAELRAGRASEKIIGQLSFEEAMPFEETVKYSENPDIQMPVATLAGYDCIGIIEIPSLKLRLPVISEWDYNALRISPCRYTGSVYQNNLVICAHNYTSHFGRINTLNTGDSALFYDIYGNIFRFNVNSIETADAKASEIIAQGNWDLTLFTCTASGASRVCVRFVRYNSIQL